MSNLELFDFDMLEKNKDYDDLPPFAIGEGDKECNLFSGKWMWDEINRPLYNESECPYLLPQVTCQEYGRPDKEYLYWRWQPDCIIPRFITFSFNEFKSRSDTQSIPPLCRVQRRTLM